MLLRSDGARDLFALVAKGVLQPDEANGVLESRKRSRSLSLEHVAEPSKRVTVDLSVPASVSRTSLTAAKPKVVVPAKAKIPATAQSTLYKHFPLRLQRGASTILVKAVDVKNAEPPSLAQQKVKCHYCDLLFGNAGAMQQHVVNRHKQSLQQKNKLQLQQQQKDSAVDEKYVAAPQEADAAPVRAVGGARAEPKETQSKNAAERAAVVDSDPDVELIAGPAAHSARKANSKKKTAARKRKDGEDDLRSNNKGADTRRSYTAEEKARAIVEKDRLAQSGDQTEFANKTVADNWKITAGMLSTWSRNKVCPCVCASSVAPGPNAMVSPHMILFLLLLAMTSRCADRLLCRSLSSKQLQTARTSVCSSCAQAVPSTNCLKSNC